MRKPRRFIIALSIFSLLLFSGCSDKRPDNILSNDEMADVLHDIHLMESMVTYNFLNNQKDKPYLYNSILKKHNLTSSEFEENLGWYYRNKKEFIAVYEAVSNRLKEEKNILKPSKAIY